MYNSAISQYLNIIKDFDQFFYILVFIIWSKHLIFVCHYLTQIFIATTVMHQSLSCMLSLVHIFIISIGCFCLEISSNFTIKSLTYNLQLREKYLYAVIPYSNSPNFSFLENLFLFGSCVLSLGQIFPRTRRMIWNSSFFI